MPKKGKPRSRAQVAFMRKALEHGYVPLTPAQVRYFNRVVNKGRAGTAQAAKKRATAARRRAS